jgi:diguanylate cyclase (GGDEF)-like protein/PAS domain S-box-containing protein
MLGAIDMAPTGIALIAPDGAWLHVNPALCALLGAPADELRDSPGAFIDSTRVARPDTLTGHAACWRHRDGTRLHVRLDATPLHDGSGWLLHVIDDGPRHRAEAERDLFFALAPDLLAVVDPQGALLETNPAWRATLGWTAGELRGKPLADLAHEDDRGRLKAFLQAAWKQDDEMPRIRLRARHGGWRWLEWSARVLDGQRLYCSARDVNGQVRAREAMLRHRDEMERRIAERTAELDAALARLHLHADNSPLATIEWDSALRVSHWSRRARELFGWSEDEVLGRHPVQWPFLHPDDAGAIDDAMQGLFRRERSRNVHVNRVMTRDGRQLRCEWFDSALFDAEGEVSSILSLLQDVTGRDAASAALQRARDELEAKVVERTLELERLMAVLENQARQDPLTGLPNRRGLMERLPRALNRSERQSGAAVVMFVDLDRFKQVNDRLGHEAGDALLRECAERLVAAVRRTDIVARLGGDEFVIVLENVQAPEMHARQVAEKIRRSLAEPMVLDGVPVAVSASIGVVVHHEEAATPEELIARADRRMYRAKHGGGNAVQLHAPEPEPAVMRALP